MNEEAKKIARLVLLFIQFLKNLEEVLDPEEKTRLDDQTLALVEGIAQKFAE